MVWMVPRVLGFLQCYDRVSTRADWLELVPDILNQYPVEYLMVQVV